MITKLCLLADVAKSAGLSSACCVRPVVIFAYNLLAILCTSLSVKTLKAYPIFVEKHLTSPRFTPVTDTDSANLAGEDTSADHISNKLHHSLEISFVRFKKKMTILFTD